MNVRTRFKLVQISWWDQQQCHLHRNSRIYIQVLDLVLVLVLELHSGVSLGHE